MLVLVLAHVLAAAVAPLLVGRLGRRAFLVLALRGVVEWRRSITAPAPS